MAKFKVKRHNKKTAHNSYVRKVARTARHPAVTIPLVTFAILLMISVLVIVIFSGGGRPEFQDSGANTVTVTYDGQEQTLPTRAETVGEVLDRLGINTNQGDVVEPSRDTSIVTDNFHINVYRAVPVTIVDDGKKTFAYTAAATPRSVVKEAGIEVYPEDVLEFIPTENFLLEGSLGQRVVIERATPVHVNLYGTQVMMRTHAETVGELLEERNINLGQGESVQPERSTEIEPDMQIFLLQEGEQIATVEEEISMPTETVDDPNLAYGTIAVRQEGSPGKKLVTYRVKHENGQEVSREAIQEVVVQNPVKRIVAKGSIPLTMSLQEWLRILRECESGSNYRTNTGNNYYGAYQFREDTWNRVAPMAGRPDLVGVRPDLASPADQDYMVIANTNLSSGGLETQHPGCYQKERLSRFPPVNH